MLASRRPLLRRRAGSGGEAPLEELAASFARFFGAMDLEKTDVIAGLALAQVMQASWQWRLLQRQRFVCCAA